MSAAKLYSTSEQDISGVQLGERHTHESSSKDNEERKTRKEKRKHKHRHKHRREKGDGEHKRHRKEKDAKIIANGDKLKDDSLEEGEFGFEEGQVVVEEKELTTQSDAESGEITVTFSEIAKDDRKPSKGDLANGSHDAGVAEMLFKPESHSGKEISRICSKYDDSVHAKVAALEESRNANDASKSISRQDETVKIRLESNGDLSCVPQNPIPHTEESSRVKPDFKQIDSPHKDHVDKVEIDARLSRKTEDKSKRYELKDLKDHNLSSNRKEDNHARERERKSHREDSSRHEENHAREVLNRDSESMRTLKQRERSRSRDRSRQSFPKERKLRSRSRSRDRKILPRSRSRDRNASPGPRDRQVYPSSRGRRDRSRSRDKIEHDRNHRPSHRAESSPRDRDSRGGHSKSNSNRHEKQESSVKRQEDDVDEGFAERVAMKLKEQEEDDPEKVKEASRKRRQAILEKYKRQQEEKNRIAAEPKIFDNGGVCPNKEFGLPSDNPPGSSTVNTRFETPLSLDSNIVQHSEIATADGDQKPIHGESTQSVDMVQFNANIHPPDYGAVAVSDAASSLQAEGRNAQQNGGDSTQLKCVDMFSDDIFGESPVGGPKLARTDGAALEASGLTDNWDDADGYYTFRIGEMLDGRYEVASSHGRGVFSSVVKAWDTKAGANDAREVAIKIIRSNDTMYKAGQQELVILNKLAGADPENRRHCVRLISSFEYRHHLCLVFELLHMNLREILKKFGRNIGINLVAVRSYATQLLISLKHLRNCGVLHCDIKPDNMLVNEAKNVLKLADFGSAMFAGENEITPYLVSRFYRAPEIMLGLPYDHALDMWSVGCCLYEMYTGKILFPGRSNNEMLRLHMELKGAFPKKLLKKATFVEQHFDSDYNFLATEEDPVTKRLMSRLITNIHPKEIGSLIGGTSGDEDPKMLSAFKDLLEKMFVLDPSKRINVSQAMNHPFIVGKAH